MEFREALKIVYQSRKNEGDITDPFYLYCKLSDLCKSSYQAKIKMELFYKIDKEVCIFGQILENKEEGEKNLLSHYDKVKGIVEKKHYESLITLVGDIVNNRPPKKAPQKVVNAHHNKQNSPKQQAKKNQPSPKNNHQNNNQQTQNQNTNVPSAKPYEVILLMALGIGAIALAIGCFVLLICGLTCKDWNITLRQWLIGICGSIVILVVYILVKEWGEVLDTIFLTVFVLFNIVMIFILRENYKIIFGCFYVTSLLVNLCCETEENYKKIVFLAHTGFLIVGYIIS